MYFCIKIKKQKRYDYSYIWTCCFTLIGWGLAELKNKTVKFFHSEKEAEGEEEMLEAFEAHGGKEMSLKDILANNSTKGFKSI